MPDRVIRGKSRDCSILIKQLHLACLNRDEAAARRLVRAMVVAIAKVSPDEPVDIGRAEAVLRCYAAELYGWEIGG